MGSEKQGGSKNRGVKKTGGSKKNIAGRFGGGRFFGVVKTEVDIRIAFLTPIGFDDFITSKKHDLKKNGSKTPT